MTYCMVIKGIQLPLIAYAAPFPVWMVFFVMGVMAAQGLLKPVRQRWLVAGVALSIILCCAEIYSLWSLTGKVVSGLKLSAQAYSLFIVWLLFTPAVKDFYNAKISNTKVATWLQETGRLSFFIYLTHLLVLPVLHRLLHLPSSWLLIWTCGVAGSYLMAKITHSIVPAKYGKYLGF